MNVPWPSVRSWRRQAYGLLLSVVLAPVSVGAADAQPKRPDPPWPRLTHYEPDAQGCRPEQIEAAFHHQLQPFADQSAAVLERLRTLQAELTSASIRRCQAKGYLSSEQALLLNRSLRLPQQPTLP